MTVTTIDPLQMPQAAPAAASAMKWTDIAFATNGRWRIAYQGCGDPADPAVMLIMGLGAQMTAWPDEFCFALAASGYHVVRLDNRDIGLSSRGVAMPRIILHVLLAPAPFFIRPEYRLVDMAGDVAAVMDALGIAKAHIAGVSMGGMIAQHMAVSFPDRVRSVVALMTSTGRPGLPGPSPALRRLFLRRTDPSDAPKWMADRVEILQAINSPAYPESIADLKALVAGGYERGKPHGPGSVRQMSAILADGSRVRMLQSLKVPLLVVHGDADPLIPVAAGLDIAKSVPGTQALIFKGMGHHVPTRIAPLLAAKMAEFFASH